MGKRRAPGNGSPLSRFIRASPSRLRPLTLSLSRASSPWRACHSTLSASASGCGWERGRTEKPSPLAGEGGVRLCRAPGEGPNRVNFTFLGRHGCPGFSLKGPAESAALIQRRQPGVVQACEARAGTVANSGQCILRSRVCNAPLGGARDDAAAMRNAQSPFRADDEVSPEATNGEAFAGAVKRNWGAFHSAFARILVHFPRFRSRDVCKKAGRCVDAAQFRPIVVNSPLPHRGPLTGEWLIAFIPV